jgi:hypothetical protein
MLYLNKTKQKLLYIAATILFLLIDLGQFFLMGTAAIPFLLCFYSTLIIHNPRYSLLSLLAFLIGLEYFCFYNTFSLACMSLLPLFCCGVFFKKNLYPSPAHLFTLCLMGIIIQTYAIEGYFLHMWSMDHYTIMRISGTLLITICFSLTINIWGVQDNRA